MAAVRWVAGLVLGHERAAGIWAESGGAKPDDSAEHLLVMTRDEASEIGAQFGTLTRREREVLELMCQHLTDPEIARRLFIGKRTAETHVANVLRKLGVTTRRQAVAMAARGNAAVGARGVG